MAGARSGHQAIVGFRKAAAWHTALALGAGHRAYILSDGITGSQTVEKLLDNSLGQTFLRDVETGRINLPGTLEMFNRYDGRTPEWIAAVIGADSEVDAGGAGDATDHTQTFQATNIGIFYTYATRFSDNRIIEVPSFKPTGFTLAGSKGNPITLTVRGIGDLPIFALASQVNTLASMAAITLDEDAERTRIIAKPGTGFTFEYAAFAGTLAAIGIEAFTLTVDRVQTGDFLDNDATAGVDEPCTNEHATGTLQITLPKEDLAGLVWDFTEGEMDNTQFFAKLNFINPDPDAIETGFTYSDVWYFRKLYVNKVAPALTSPGKVPFTVDFGLLADSTTTHTGLPTFDGLLQRILRNGNTANLLA